MDELFESLCLTQTHKVRNFPVVLFGSEYWGGLVDWLRGTMAVEGKVSQKDLDLMFVTDSPEEARDHIVQRYERSKEMREGVRSSDPARPE